MLCFKIVGIDERLVLVNQKKSEDKKEMKLFNKYYSFFNLMKKVVNLII